MRVCHVIPSLAEHHGGPSKSVAALAEAIAALGHQVDLLATHAGPAESSVRGTLRRSIVPRSWPARLACSVALERELAGQRYEVIHHHALWLRTLHYAHRQARATDAPLVISPRGMMSDWAWSFHRGRKRFARQFVHPCAFEAAAGWHATSEEEASDIRARGFHQPVCVAPNGVHAPDVGASEEALAHWHRVCPDLAGRRTALFYSRFHRKKRVLELIDLWLSEAPADWLLLMVGLPDEYTAEQVESYAFRRSGAGRVRVFGGARQPPPYAAAALFLLPSHSENFGLAIAEAMAAGVPVVVTDGTPWRAVNREEIGWCVSWPDYRDALRCALRESPEALAARGRRAREYVLAACSWHESAQRLCAFYRALLGRHG